MATFEKRLHKKTGKPYFRAKVRLQGACVSESFERLTDARTWAADTEASIRQGKHFPYAQARRHSVSELVDRYIADELPKKPRDARNRIAQLRWWQAEIGHLKLHEVTRAVLATKRDELLSSDARRQRQSAPAKKKTGATVRRYLAALSHAFTIAVKEWEWVEDNPFLKISKPAESRGRNRFLDKAELARLLEACRTSRNPHLHDIVVLAVSTGMRKGEILSLRRKDVDCAAGQVTLSTTKNGDLRIVPLSGKALSLIGSRVATAGNPDDLLFPGTKPERPSEIAKAWTNAVKKAGAADLRFHDLRHSCATFLVDSGATDLQIAAVLGHRTLAMVKRYAHVRRTLAASVVADMNKRIFSEA